MLQQKCVDGQSLLLRALEKGGAPTMWERAVLDMLSEIRRSVPPDSKVIEVGYGDGLLTCYFCSELGWEVTGFDILTTTRDIAQGNACRLGLENKAVFNCCTPEKTWQQTGEYDAVFIKTVLYNAPSFHEYGKWLDWVLSVLRPGGVLVNFETGRANRLVQAYRRMRGREYTDFLLYTGEVEQLYDERFVILERRYYGGWSQFLAPLAPFYRVAYRTEETFRKRDADNCFIVGMIARKPE